MGCFSFYLCWKILISSELCPKLHLIPNLQSSLCLHLLTSFLLVVYSWYCWFLELYLGTDLDLVPSYFWFSLLYDLLASLFFYLSAKISYSCSVCLYLHLSPNEHLLPLKHLPCFLSSDLFWYYLYLFSYDVICCGILYRGLSSFLIALGAWCSGNWCLGIMYLGITYKGVQGFFNHSAYIDGALVSNLSSSDIALLSSYMTQRRQVRYHYSYGGHSAYGQLEKTPVPTTVNGS